MTGVSSGVRIEEEIIKAAPVKKIELAEKVAIEKDKKTRKTKIFARNKKKHLIQLKADKKPTPSSKKEEKPVSGHPLGLPILEVTAPSISVLEQKMDIIRIPSGSETKPEERSESYPIKKTIRRSGLEIKKAEEIEEKKRIAQEKEWEIPAFLRKVKFKS